MSTASPDTCGDVSGVATQRAASSSRAVLRDRLVEQLLLVRRGTPAAVDVELDPVVRGIRCGLAQGTEEGRVEVGHGRILVVEDRHAVRDDPVGLAKRTVGRRLRAARDARRALAARRRRRDGGCGVERREPASDR